MRSFWLIPFAAQVCFSPDARFIASASFDKSVKLWDGRTGKYVLKGQNCFPLLVAPVG